MDLKRKMIASACLVLASAMLTSSAFAQIATKSAETLAAEQAALIEALKAQLAAQAAKTTTTTAPTAPTTALKDIAASVAQSTLPSPIDEKSLTSGTKTIDQALAPAPTTTKSAETLAAEQAALMEAMKAKLATTTTTTTTATTKTLAEQAALIEALKAQLAATTTATTTTTTATTKTLAEQAALTEALKAKLAATTTTPKDTTAAAGLPALPMPIDQKNLTSGTPAPAPAPAPALAPLAAPAPTRSIDPFAAEAGPLTLLNCSGGAIKVKTFSSSDAELKAAAQETSIANAASADLKCATSTCKLKLSSVGATDNAASAGQKCAGGNCKSKGSPGGATVAMSGYQVYIGGVVKATNKAAVTEGCSVY